MTEVLPPSSGPQLIDHDSAPLAQAADGQSSGTSSATFSLTSETVTSPGSGLVFVNKYGSGVNQAFHDCIIAAEHFFQSNFTNACTLNVSFDLKSLGSNFVAYNNFSFAHVSYAALKNALATRDTTSAEQIAAVHSLPTTDPSHGAGFNLPVGYADMLGLSSASGTDCGRLEQQCRLELGTGRDRSNRARDIRRSHGAPWWPWRTKQKLEHDGLVPLRGFWRT